MHASLLTAGIILMVFGVIGFLYVQQASSDCESIFGQIGRAFSSSAEQRCQMANYIQLGGGVLFVIGIGLTIGGAAAKERSE